MTENQRQKILQAINESNNQLDRANRYLPEFRDYAYIQSCEAHINRLNNSLATSNFAALFESVDHNLL